MLSMGAKRIEADGVATCGRPIRFPLAVFVVICATLPGPSRAASPASEDTSVGPVVRDLCGKGVALIGESRGHGFGKTLEFKGELVRRLVAQCHYNAVFFESGIYDFLSIQEQVRSGHDVTDSMIAAAIGGIWANDEVQRVVPFLRDEAAHGRLYLGGLDDQLGRGTWAQNEMPASLTAYLPADERARCLGILQKHMRWQYTSGAPYGPADKTRILACLDRISARLREGDVPGRAAGLAMVDSLERQFNRDFPDVPAGMDADTWWTNARDRSMYLNFRWLLSQLPPHSKVVVWTATVHAAKELKTVPGEEKRVPLGFYIHRDLGRRAFALGFSAYSGSYATVGQPVRPLDPAPDGSLEARSLAGRDGDTVYLSRSDLRKVGPVAARPLGTDFTTARWDEVVDGLVVFRREHPPE
jgi:erythromycin esterase-like protein